MKFSSYVLVLGVLFVAPLVSEQHHAKAATAKADGGIAIHQHASAVAAAKATLDEFMLAFNARDMGRWAQTLHYPHVRFASGSVKVWDSAAEFNQRAPFKALVATGWDHSHWLSRDVVLASPNKVHLATRFARYNNANEVIGIYESLYIVTKQGKRWGIQARSSLAP